MVGLVTDLLGESTFLARVTLLLLFGALIGSQLFDLIPTAIYHQFELITQVTLLMIGFLLSGRLTLPALRKMGTQLSLISGLAAVGAALIVGGGMLLTGLPRGLAIILGSIVAIDDAWALVIFSLGLTFVSASNGGLAFSPFSAGLEEILGSLLLGFCVGLPGTYLTGRIKADEPMLTEALGLVFVCGGPALWLDFSFLLAVRSANLFAVRLMTARAISFEQFTPLRKGDFSDGFRITVVQGKNMVAKNTLKENKARKRQCSLVFDSVISPDR